MKKKIQILFFAVFAVFQVEGQIEKISFENSEGYVIGNINTQNQWVESSSQNTNYNSSKITNSRSSEGSNSLQFKYSSTDHGGFIPTSYVYKQLSNSYSKSRFSIDFYLSSTSAKNMHIGLFTSNGSLVADFFFSDFSNFIGVYNPEHGQWYSIGNQPILRNQWVKLAFEIDKVNKKVKYFVNGQQIYITANLVATEFSRLDIDFTDTSSLNFFVDNIMHENLVAMSVDNDAKNQLQFYPNPTKDFISIKNDRTESFAYQIIDASGKIVKTGKAKTEERIDVRGLVKGNYVLQMEIESGEKLSLKLIKN